MKAYPLFRKAQRQRFRVMSKHERDEPGLLWKMFASPVNAFAFTFFLIIVVLCLYASIHAIRKGPQYPPQDFVTVENNGDLRLDYNYANLERFYAKPKISEIQGVLEARRKEMSQSALQRRRAVFVPVLETIHALAWNPSPPGLLGKKATAAIDNDFLLEDTALAAQWITNHLAAFEPNKQANMRTYADQLAEIATSEAKMAKSLTRNVKSLDPVLPFCWLYTDCGWWSVEVVAWSLLGVLANTVITLITILRKQEDSSVDHYSPDIFLFILPKILLAPLLAFIVVAFWATGMSESKINFLNLPYFLVTSFLLGFMTESLYDRIRKLGDLVLPMAAVDKDKLEAAAANTPYRYVNTPPAEGAGAPATLKELETRLKATAKSTIERGLVARLNNQ